MKQVLQLFLSLVVFLKKSAPAVITEEKVYNFPKSPNKRDISLQDETILLIDVN